MRFSGTLFYRAPEYPGMPNQAKEKQLKEMVMSFKGWAEDDLSYQVEAFYDKKGRLSAEIKVPTYGYGNTPEQHEVSQVLHQTTTFFGLIPTESMKTFFYRITRQANSLAGVYFNQYFQGNPKPH
jgi:hypothetical protein